MIHPAALELFLRLAILKLGGEMTIRMDDLEVTSIDDVILFAEGTAEGDGVILSTARAGDAEAGHA